MCGIHTLGVILKHILNLKFKEYVWNTYPQEYSKTYFEHKNSGFENLEANHPCLSLLCFAMPMQPRGIGKERLRIAWPKQALWLCLLFTFFICTFSHFKGHFLGTPTHGTSSLTPMHSLHTHTHTFFTLSFVLFLFFACLRKEN